MKRILLNSLILFYSGMSALCTHTLADSKIGVVDILSIQSASAFKQQFSQMQKELDEEKNLANKLQKLQLELAQNEGIMDAKTHQQQSKKLRALYDQLLRKEAERQKIALHVEQIIKDCAFKIAREKKVDLLIYSSGEVLYAGKELDLTEQFKKTLSKVRQASVSEDNIPPVDMTTEGESIKSSEIKDTRYSEA